MAGSNSGKGLTKSKARRQRDNTKKYELHKIKLEKKKKTVKEKRERTKAAWIKKDKKKNGKLVKGGLSHGIHLEEKVHGSRSSDEDSNAHDGGGERVGGEVIQR